MRYAFVSISIVSVWVATILTVIVLDEKGMVLPLVALITTMVLFTIGFRTK